MRIKTGCRGGAAALTAVMALAAVALAGPLPVDFDAGAPSAGRIVERVREDAGAKAAVPKVVVGVRADQDCASISFEPAGPSISEAVPLRSTEYVEECERDRADADRGCWEHPGVSYEKKIRLELVGAGTLPWETQTFEACLQGPLLRLKPIAAAYDYEVRGDNDGYFTLTSLRKIPTAPDKLGVTVGPLTNTGRGLALSFSDRWSGYYGAGERTALRVELRRAGRPGDAPVLTTDLTFAPAISYLVDFASLGAFLEPGESYFVRWRFQRIGKVSLPAEIDGRDTPPAVFAPTLASFF